MTDQGILTGEGVLLETRPAAFASRMLGGLIDAAAYVAGTLLVLMVVGVLGGGSDYSAAIFSVSGVLVIRNLQTLR